MQIDSADVRKWRYPLLWLTFEFWLFILLIFDFKTIINRGLYFECTSQIVDVNKEGCPLNTTTLNPHTCFRTHPDHVHFIKYENKVFDD